MTMGWHIVMEFTPSLVGCIIANGNHSFELIRDSGECVINVPSTALTNTVVGIGNTSAPTSTSSPASASRRTRRAGQGAADPGVLRQLRVPSTTTPWWTSTTSSSSRW
jgi:flavin reductase (DIM6/NTAB) family NADH-FMN oxidoreductase RutF